MTAAASPTGRGTRLTERQAILLGVGLMVFAGLSASVLHVGVRIVSQHLPTVEVVFLRSMFTMLATMPALVTVGRISWRTNNLPLQMIRGVVGVGSMTIWYYALAVMPMADANVLGQTTAIFVTIGAALWFKEAVGWRRWTAVACGITGAVIVLRPGLSVISFGAVAALFSSVLWALSLLMAKELSRYDSSLTISFYQPLTISALAMIPALWVWVWPSQHEWLLLIGMGAAAAVGNYCYIHALRIADVSITMPSDYLKLLWAAIWGYMLFAEVPLWTTWAGAALIVSSTLWLTWSEQRLARLRAAGAAAAGKAGEKQEA